MKRTLIILCCLLPIGLSAAESVRWTGKYPRDAKWYATPEHQVVADTMLAYQFPSGGWPKNIDMGVKLTSGDRGELKARAKDESTIDNGATTTQIRMLAAFFVATNDERYRKSVERGLVYLLAAQYPNGGWPQYFPVRAGYYEHITFNDNAMAEVLGVLRDVAVGVAPFAWVDESLRIKAGGAVSRGIGCILKCQVVQNGRPTGWGAQHDGKTFAPAWARKFEPPSLASGESVGIVRFLMSLPQPHPAIIAAIEGAVEWLEESKITGIRWDKTDASAPGGVDRLVVLDPTAPPLWARFYELGTNRPIFAGREGVVRYKIEEIERERRLGYAWYVNSPVALLQKDYPAWKARLAKSATATPATNP